MKAYFLKIIKKDSFWIILLILTSSLFRLSLLSNIEFKSDEALSFYQVYSFFHYHQFPLKGIMSSIGVYNPPLFTYMLILLSAFSTNPQFLTFMIALLNVLIIPVFYLFVKKFYSPRIAIFSSVLLAFSPWGILFSRKIWAQDLLIIFLVPFLYFLHRLIYIKDTKSSFLVVLLGVLVLQIHGSGIFFLVITIIYFVYKKIKIDFRAASLGLFLGVLPSIPYLLYQFSYGSFCNDCGRFTQFISTTYTNNFSHFLRPFQLLSAFYFDFELGNDSNTFFHSNVFLILTTFIGLFSVLLIFVGIWFILKRGRKHVLLLFYIILLPTLYIISGINSSIAYYAVLLPVIAIVAGLGFQYVLDLTKNKLQRTGIYLCFSLLIASFVIFELSFNAFLIKQKIIHGDYGPIYEVGNTYVNNELKHYKSYPYYDELKYYAFIYLYTDSFHVHLGDFFLAKKDYKDARREYSIETSTLPFDLLSQ